jgi:Uma2 family endonuclease
MHATYVSGVEPRRWTRAEYDRMIEHGLLGEDDPVELIDGEILRMTPQGIPHAGGIGLVHDALCLVFGHTHVRTQLPFALDPVSEPEPDLVVVPGSPRDYLEAHPDTALLVVEVADTTLAFARRTKGSLYARAGIAEYWIVNVSDGALEVYREPAEDPSARYGFAYGDTRVLRAGDQVAPLAAPDAELPVADLLP